MGPNHMEKQACFYHNLEHLEKTSLHNTNININILLQYMFCWSLANESSEVAWSPKTD